LAKDIEKGELLGKLAVAREAGQITREDVLDLERDIEYRKTSEQPLIITFGALIEDVISQRELPDSITDLPDPYFYVRLCDFLEEELDANLRSMLTYSFHYTEASARSGETLSVRIVFPELSADEVDKVKLPEIQVAMPWWEVLEVATFHQIYGTTYKEAYDL
jgi:hypothetical protein